jgi:hypothetical protein
MTEGFYLKIKSPRQSTLALRRGDPLFAKGVQGGVT